MSKGCNSTPWQKSFQLLHKIDLALYSKVDSLMCWRGQSCSKVSWKFLRRFSKIPNAIIQCEWWQRRIVNPRLPLSFRTSCNYINMEFSFRDSCSLTSWCSYPWKSCNLKTRLKRSSCHRIVCKNAFLLWPTKNWCGLCCFWWFKFWRHCKGTLF